MEDLKEPVEKIQENIRKLAETQVKYIRLWTFKVIMKTIMRMMQFMLIFFFLGMAALFLSVSLALNLGQLLDSNVLGFMIVGLAYVVMIPAVALWVVPKLLKKPLLQTFSKIYLDE